MGPEAGPTVVVSQEAMACDFSVHLNPGPVSRIEQSTRALELVSEIETQISVYLPESEISELNRTALERAVPIEESFYRLLRLSAQLSEGTARGFDPTSGPLVSLWRSCRREGRIPLQTEIEEVLKRVGMPGVIFDDSNRSVLFSREGMELNLGSIGKGYALDRAGEVLQLAGVESFLIQGGRSSILAKGPHHVNRGWPVGIRHPLFIEREIARVLLCDQAMGTSGTGVQSYRVGGRRYGHILSPMTGWPVDTMLTVSVLAPTGAEADALSTGFFVSGVENALQYCHNHRNIGVMLIPQPRPGHRPEIHLCGSFRDQWWIDREAASLQIHES